MLYRHHTVSKGSLRYGNKGLPSNHAVALGSLHNHNSNGNVNSKKAIGLDWQTTTLLMHHAF